MNLKSFSTFLFLFRTIPFNDTDPPKDNPSPADNPNDVPTIAVKEKSTGKSSKDVSHPGVAIPMTAEDIEREIAEVDNRVVKETSTPKEGISTWILLSGTNPTGKPNNSRGPAYRIESESNIEKLEKLARVEEGVRPKESLKNKYKASKPINSSTPFPSVNVESNETVVKPVRPSNPKKKLDQQPRPTKTTTPTTQKRKPSTKNPVMTTKTTSTTETSVAPLTTQTPVTDEPVPFLIMEAKDADFNLPSDRSPGKSNKVKKPNNNNNNNNNKTKKKNNNKKEIETGSDKNSTKVANKIKEKPVTTQIYNYFAREVMPTVGVGLIGLVVTAGLAGYFFGPLGALRRSYDIADRKDDLYYYNNEEYAGTDGQSEEDMFGKVIAGMPLNYKSNNIRYTGPNGLNSYGPQNGPKYPYQQQPFGNRYREAGRPQMPYINYQSNVKQPMYAKTQINNQNSVLKKSIASPVYRSQQQQPTLSPAVVTTTMRQTKAPTTTSQTEANTNPSSAPLHMEPDTQSPVVIVSPVKLHMDQANEIMQRSPQQFVVGSVLPDNISADMDNMAAPVPEHGPRRRRRRSLENTPSDATLKPIEDLYTKLKHKYNKSVKNEKIAKEMKNVEYEFQRVRRISAEVKDIVQFQNEFHIGGLNSELRDTVANGVAHLQGNIQFVNELLDNPRDVEKKMSDRKKMQNIVSSREKLSNYPAVMQSKMDVVVAENVTTQQNGTDVTVVPAIGDGKYNATSMPDIEVNSGTEKPTGLMALLKLLELKAQFGVNLMRSVRPAFDKAFRDVFSFNMTAAPQSEMAVQTTQLQWLQYRDMRLLHAI